MANFADGAVEHRRHFARHCRPGQAGQAGALAERRPVFCAALIVHVEDRGLYPARAAAMARLVASVVLPTPPFWAMMAMIFKEIRLTCDQPTAEIKVRPEISKTRAQVDGFPCDVCALVISQLVIWRPCQKERHPAGPDASPAGVTTSCHNRRSAHWRSLRVPWQ